MIRSKCIFNKNVIDEALIEKIKKKEEETGIRKYGKLTKKDHLGKNLVFMNKNKKTDSRLRLKTKRINNIIILIKQTEKFLQTQ